MLDSGAIQNVAAIELTQVDLEIIDQDRIKTIWVSDDYPTDIVYEKKVVGLEDVEATVDKLRNMIYEDGSIFRPW